MHPLPRVGEISMDFDDDPRAAYFRADGIRAVRADGPAGDGAGKGVGSIARGVCGDSEKIHHR